MMGWVFNASPLILLGKLELLHALEILAPNFRIPREVVNEIGAGPLSDPTIHWLSDHCLSQHIVDAPPPPAHLVQWDLGAGETAVLTIGLQDRATTVVLDDRAARKFALTYDIRLIGTLGILIRAKQQGIIKELLPYISSLTAVGANLSEAVIAEALELAGEA